MSYLQKIYDTTPTRVWLNNPLLEEIDLALEQKAVACTLNPAFCSRIIKLGKDNVMDIIRDAAAEEPDDARAADLVQRRMALPIMEKFFPLFEKSGGTYGLVDIQGNPYNDGDADLIFEECVEYSKLLPNFCAKIPIVTEGLLAIEKLVRNNIPIIATEIMSISQAVTLWETYEATAQSCGNYPPLFTTHITGIFDEYLSNYVRENNVDISEDILQQAGSIVANKQYRIMKEKNYHGKMLGGGARNATHFINMVGGDMDVTMNWVTFEELNALDHAIEDRIHSEYPAHVIEELREKLPDFRKAYDDDGLDVEQYRDFGPVEYFRDSFVAGWDVLQNAIKTCRTGK